MKQPTPPPAHVVLGVLEELVRTRSTFCFKTFNEYVDLLTGFLTSIAGRDGADRDRVFQAMLRLGYEVVCRGYGVPPRVSRGRTLARLFRDPADRWPATTPVSLLVSWFNLGEALVDTALDEIVADEVDTEEDMAVLVTDLLDACAGTRLVPAAEPVVLPFPEAAGVHAIRPGLLCAHDDESCSALLLAGRPRFIGKASDCLDGFGVPTRTLLLTTGQVTVEEAHVVVIPHASPATRRAA